MLPKKKNNLCSSTVLATVGGIFAVICIIACESHHIGNETLYFGMFIFGSQYLPDLISDFVTIKTPPNGWRAILLKITIFISTIICISYFISQKRYLEAFLMIPLIFFIDSVILPHFGINQKNI